MDNNKLAHLYHKYLSNTCTAKELKEFHAYLRDPAADEHLRALMKDTYTGIRINSGTLVDAGGQLVAGTAAPLLPRRLPEQRRRRAIRAGVTAGLALVLAAAWFLRPQKAVPVVTTGTKKTLTHPSEYKYVLLPDSTQVWLNAGSSLEFPDRFDSGSREVVLAGEAFFDVKHAAEHPFLIHTGRILTRVLGTAFDINAYPDRKEITISVSRGRVEVQRDDRTVATLVRGQELRLSGTDSTAGRRKKILVSDVAVWQQGMLDYDDERFAEVVADLGRVYNEDVVIQSEKLQDLRISTRLRRAEGLNQALYVLCRLTDTHVVYSHNRYIIQ